MSERAAAIFVEQSSWSILDGGCSHAVRADRKRHPDRHHHRHGAIRQSPERGDSDFLSDLWNNAYLEAIDFMDSGQSPFLCGISEWTKVFGLNYGDSSALTTWIRFEL